MLLRPPVSMADKQVEWESRSVTSHEVNRRWTEGSVTFKKDGIYYIMYSANHFAGQTMLLVMPLQSLRLVHLRKQQITLFYKKTLPVAVRLSGTGHNSITYSPDGKEMFCVYHGRTAETGDERVVFIDRMKVNNGKITVCGPTTTPAKITIRCRS
ncbi:MAG: family 43 glycosylhydrolase [Segetibacter sp.]